MLILDEAGQQAHGVDVASAAAKFEQELAMPLEVELTTDEIEQARRRRVAEENREAQQRMTGLLDLPRRPFA